MRPRAASPGVNNAGGGVRKPQVPESSESKPGEDSGKVASAEQYVCIGRVGRAHGLAGAFFISDRDTPIPRSYGRLLIGNDPESARATTVTSCVMQSGRPVLRCDLSQKREDAEALVGLGVFVLRSAIGPQRGADLIWADMKGLTVNDSEGQALGIVLGLYNAGASDIIVVRGEGGRTLDLPLVPAYFDAEQVAADGAMRLKVPAADFAELWQPSGAGKPPRP